MSAWIVSKPHIDLLITAGFLPPHGLSYYWERPGGGGGSRGLTPDRATELGRELWQACFDSVDGRYPGEEPEELPGPEGFDGTSIASYVYEEIPGPIDPVVVLKSIDCFQYQASEVEDWREREAYAYLESLRIHLIDLLPGYDEAPWGFDDREFFVRRAADGG